MVHSFGLLDMRPAFAPVQVPYDHAIYSILLGQTVLTFSARNSASNFNDLLFIENGPLVTRPAIGVDATKHVKSVLGVLRRRDDFKVGKPVVVLHPVLVVDNKTIGNGAVEALPNKAVQHGRVGSLKRSVRSLSAKA